MTTALVTGANRGIGLELCRGLAARGDEVLAVCRNVSAELEALRLRVLPGVDVTDDASVAGLARELKGTRLDLLVNNAGVLEPDRLEDLDPAALVRQFDVNALGPLRVTLALLPFLGAGSKIAMITSLMGSVGDNASGGHYGYRMSKAALNMAAASLARDLAPRGIAVGVFHPGMVATRMTGRRGVPVQESAAGLIARIDELTPETSGRFRHADGRDLPW